MRGRRTKVRRGDARNGCVSVKTKYCSFGGTDFACTNVNTKKTSWARNSKLYVCSRINEIHFSRVSCTAIYIIKMAKNKNPIINEKQK